MKIKDIEDGTSLGGLRVKTPGGIIGIWRSQWNKGVWLTDGVTTRIYPIFIETLSECLEWDITEEEINVQDKFRRVG